MAATTLTRMQVRRPGGAVETVEVEGSMGNSPVWCKRATDATRAAGRGEILSFEVVNNPATQGPVETEADRLRRERRTLVSDVHAALEEQAAVYEAAHAREDVLAERIKASHEPAIEAAKAAVRAFDAAHPEIVAAIRAEQQERTARFLRQD